MNIYTKPYLEIPDLLCLLESRGLAIDVPRQLAKDFLHSVNYYRFTGYALPFLLNRDQFAERSRFSEIISVYEFDRKLRDLMSEALEVIELTFRAILARHFTRLHGPLGWMDPVNFRDISNHEKLLTNLRNDFRQSATRCAKHFRERYADPPLWALVEVMTFGRLSHFYADMLQSDQKAVALEYGIVNPKYLKSYLQHMCVLRNLCAHHGRLYDITWSGKDTHVHPYSFPELKEWTALRKAGLIHLSPRRTLFDQFMLVNFFAAKTQDAVFHRTDWKDRVIAAMKTVPPFRNEHVKSFLGIPETPESSPLWIY